MHKIWHELYKIKSYDVDCEQKLKLPSLFNYLQEVAGNQAESIGVGFEVLKQKNLFWVLSRMKIQIHNMPKWNDEIIVYTWPKGIDKLFALRDFEITNNEGKLLISATSCWLLIDTIQKHSSL
jgi:medium-chain acyl-[acyl-carrier-protein] hydrolase